MRKALLGAIAIVGADLPLNTQIQRVLTRFQTHRVQFHETAEQTLKLLQSGQEFQILILVIQSGLKRLDIFEEIIQIKSRNNRSIPYLAIVDAKTREELRTLQAHGFENFILKPVNDDQLETRIYALTRHGENTETRRENIEKIEAAIAAGDVNLAETILTVCMKKYPTTAEYLIHYADLLARRGSFIKAEEITKRALLLQPDDLNSRYIATHIFLRSGAYRELSQNLETLARIENEALNAQSRFYEGQSANKNIDKHNNLALLINNKSQNLALTGKSREAIHLYQSAIKYLKSTKIRHILHYNLAMLLFEFRDYESALGHAKLCLEEAPEVFLQGRRLLKKLEDEKKKIKIIEKTTPDIVGDEKSISDNYQNLLAMSEDLDPLIIPSSQHASQSRNSTEGLSRATRAALEAQTPEGSDMIAPQSPTISKASGSKPLPIDDMDLLKSETLAPPSLTADSFLSAVQARETPQTEESTSDDDMTLPDIVTDSNPEARDKLAFIMFARSKY